MMTSSKTFNIYTLSSHEFQCGLCKKVYPSASKALKCLESDGLIKQLIPMTRYHWNIIQFRCPVCNTYYDSLKNAQTCSKKCLNIYPIPESLHSVIQELCTQSMRTSDHLAPKINEPSSEEISQDILKELSSKTAQTVDTTEPQKSTATTDPVSSTPPNAAPAIPPKPAFVPKPDADKKFRLPNQKSFVRMDAAYECTVCRSRYFSKDDVESCFNSHPLLEESGR
jgi:hypothetical protein